MTTLTADSTTGNRKNILRSLVPSLVRDIGLPTLAYYLLHWTGASDWTALLAGAGVSALLLIVEAVRARRFEVFSAFMLCVFTAGLIASLISGDARMLIVKDSFVTAAVGLAFGLSALAAKPLMYFAARKIHSEPAEFDAMYQSMPALRRRFKMLSGMWGIGLVLEATVRVVLAYQLPVDTMVWLSNVLFFAVITLLMVITVKSAKRAAAKKGR